MRRWWLVVCSLTLALAIACGCRSETHRDTDPTANKDTTQTAPRRKLPPQ
jgi:hypothetical protein